MKVLFINTTYNIGSTGKLTHNFLEYLHQNGHDVLCIYANGKMPDYGVGLKLKNTLSRKATILLERLTGKIGSFSPFSTHRACRFIEKYKPDIIYLGNLHGYYINIFTLYKFLKKKNIPCVQIMWDEFSMTGSCAFSFECDKYKSMCMKCPRLKDYPSSWFIDNSTDLFLKKKKAYDYDRLTFVSVPYIISEAHKSALLSSKKLFPIDEAIDQDNLFFPRNTDKLRKELGIAQGNIVILTVAVYPSERKGCKYFLDAARHLSDNNKFTFVHVGFLGDKSECPHNYIPIGFVKNQELLAEYYSLADLFVCTSFAETQPNTCLEALSCGTRICGFNISGIPTCADAPFGEYVTPRDVNALAKVIENTSKKTEFSITETRKYAESRFSSNDYNRRLLDVGMNLLNC